MNDPISSPPDGIPPEGAPAGDPTHDDPPAPASVVVLFNHVGEDEYEKVREVDPDSLGFEPQYDIHVATIMDEYRAVRRALRRAGYKARLVNIKDDVSVLERLLRRNPPDAVFNLVEHYRDDPEHEAHIAGVMDLHHVPYTGAPPFVLSLCRRKGLTKHLLMANGVPTPHYRILHEPKIPRRHGLRYPLIVKPSREDASAGVTRESVVSDYAALVARAEWVYHEFGAPILVEEFIEGRELHVAVWGNDEDTEVLPIIEFDFSDMPEEHPNIISFDAKWNPLKEEYHQVFTVCPARLSRKALRRVQATARDAYRVTGCRDYARLDIRLTADDHPFVLEVNPNPDLTEGVSFMESAEKAGYEFGQALATIVEMALERRHDPAAPAPSPSAAFSLLTDHTQAPGPGTPSDSAQG